MAKKKKKCCGNCVFWNAETNDSCSYLMIFPASINIKSVLYDRHAMYENEGTKCLCYIEYVEGF